VLALTIPPAGNGVCFNPRELFPADTQWGLYDTRDVCNMTHIVRSFFASTNATCANQTGFVTLNPSPLNRLLLDQFNSRLLLTLVSLRTDYKCFACSMSRVDKCVACSYLGTHSRFGNFYMPSSSHSHGNGRMKACKNVQTCMCSRHETVFLFLLYFYILFRLICAPDTRMHGPEP
jgi:hypothetical protein